ncbi:hypothetical protein VTN77DRAFT_4341 [Rasamsonia byssochlamydoides]|uniref:uncharacterized protein n=1 Tax=Rasamsonia byssochlamydoides TaxID=89139 RepID=UPI003742E082
MQMSMSISNLTILPILLLISVPLILLACVTIALALIVLFLRVLIVYVELAYAFLVKFFLFPAPSDAGFDSSGSLFTFLTFSESNTPGGGLPSSRSKSTSRLRHRLVGETAAANPGSESSFRTAKHHEKLTLTLTPSQESSSSFSFSDVVRSDAPTERDFEGVGWRRTIPRSSSSSISPSLNLSLSGEDDIVDAAAADDDQAWLSINKRLDLPSRSSSTSTTSSAGGTKAEAEERRRPLYHRRSVTTSSLVSGLRPAYLSSTRHASLRPSRSIAAGLERLSYTSGPNNGDGSTQRNSNSNSNTNMNTHTQFVGRPLPLSMAHPHYPVGTGGLLIQHRRRRRRSCSSGPT